MAPSLILIMLFIRCFWGRAQAGGCFCGASAWRAHPHTERANERSRIGSRRGETGKRRPLAVMAARSNGDGQESEKRTRVWKHGRRPGESRHRCSHSGWTPNGLQAPPPRFLTPDHMDSPAPGTSGCRTWHTARRGCRSCSWCEEQSGGGSYTGREGPGGGFSLVLFYTAESEKKRKEKTIHVQ